MKDSTERAYSREKVNLILVASLILDIGPGFSISVRQYIPFFVCLFHLNGLIGHDYRPRTFYILSHNAKLHFKEATRSIIFLPSGR